jgi:hypothetical protein
MDPLVRDPSRLPLSHSYKYPQKGKVLPITLLEIPSRLLNGGASTSLWRQTMAQKSYW